MLYKISSNYAILKFMNNDFDAFREAGTTGKRINMPEGQDLFSSWIANYYSEKGTRAIISNDYTMIPINKIAAAFDISATYRIKRSGSTAVGGNHISQVEQFIRVHNYPITCFRKEGPKLFVSSQQRLHNTRFILGAYEYMFSQRNSEYEIRRLSNTYNANVIFSITLRPNYQGLTTQEIIEMLTN